MKKIILILCLLFLSLSLQAQVNIDSMLVYSHFVERGYTTAGVSTQFNELRQHETKLIKVEDRDLSRIKNILNNANCKRHTQTKLGIGMLFLKLFLEDKVVDVLISKTLLVDLTNYRNYWVRDGSDQVWLEAFIQRVKEED